MSRKEHGIVRTVFVLTGLVVLVSINAYAGTFFDDFEQENDFWVVELGEWTIEEGVYHQTDTTSNGARGLSSHVEGSENWGNDFTIETRVAIFRPGIETHLEAGIMYKWQNKENQYHVVLDQDNAIVRINKCVNGTWLQNQNISMVFDLGEWHDIKVAVEDNRHEIFVDGEKIQEYEREVDDKNGFIGLKTLGCEASFDDFRVTGPNVPDSGVGLPVEPAGKLAAAWGRIKAYNKL
jgi:hypothetical protein